MLRTFAVALLAIGMSVGLAQAKGHKHTIPGCSLVALAAVFRRVAAYPVTLRFKFWRLNVFSAPTPNSVAAVVQLAERLLLFQAQRAANPTGFPLTRE
jgi:hypothetical protein